MGGNEENTCLWRNKMSIVWINKSLPWLPAVTESEFKKKRKKMTCEYLARDNFFFTRLLVVCQTIYFVMEIEVHAQLWPSKLRYPLQAKDDNVYLPTRASSWGSSTRWYLVKYACNSSVPRTWRTTHLHKFTNHMSICTVLLIRSLLFLTVHEITVLQLY